MGKVLAEHSIAKEQPAPLISPNPITFSVVISLCMGAKYQFGFVSLADLSQ